MLPAVTSSCSDPLYVSVFALGAVTVAVRFATITVTVIVTGRLSKLTDIRETFGAFSVAVTDKLCVPTGAEAGIVRVSPLTTALSELLPLFIVYVYFPFVLVPF